MEMGKEFKKDTCPPKMCNQGSVFAETLPVLIASLVVAFYSGNLFQASGLEIAVTIAIEAAVVALMYGFVFFMFRGMKKRLSETYISVCENGVGGICPKNGFQNRAFSLRYSQISKVAVKGNRLFLYSTEGNVILTLQDAARTAFLIQSRMEN